MKHMRIPTLLFAAGLAIVGCTTTEAPDDNVTPAPYEPEEPVPAETLNEDTGESEPVSPPPTETDEG